ncbi:MAG: OadG family protein [Desulfobulbaceae bacterium]|nr:OadG family protein [Desulfobulbaceae bacterium]
MDFSFINLDFSTLNVGGFDALHFSIIGMAVVFGGLSLIAGYITFLPIMLNGFSSLKNKLQRVARDNQSDGGDPDIIDDETLIAVATALHLYQFSDDDNRKITWKRHSLWDSSWQRAGRFEAMNNQGNTLAPRS